MSERKCWWVWLDDEEERFKMAGQCYDYDERAAIERYARMADLRVGWEITVRVSDHAPTHDDDGEPWTVTGRVEYDANPRPR